jgi:hypothetical protein
MKNLVNAALKTEEKIKTAMEKGNDGEMRRLQAQLDTEQSKITRQKEKEEKEQEEQGKGGRKSGTDQWRNRDSDRDFLREKRSHRKA